MATSTLTNNNFFVATVEGATTSSAGEVYVDLTAGSYYSLDIPILDVIGANAKVAYAVVPFPGTIIQENFVANVTTATGSLILTPAIGSTAITGGALTVASGVAAGTAATPVVPTSANVVTAGQVVKVTPSGTQSAAGQGVFSLKIRKA